MSNFIFGIRTVLEAISSGREMEKVLIKKGLTGDLSKELLQVIHELNIPFQIVPIERIDRVTRKNHQGVVAYTSEIEYQNIEEIVPHLFEEGKTPLILIVDGVTDVRNFGAIARTAECSGVDAIIMPQKGVAPINADAIKTSAGALNLIPVCRVKSLVLAIRFLKNSGINVIAATEKASNLYYSVDFKAPTAIVMGSEEDGVSADVLKTVDELVKIPILGSIQSLNVSVAAAVIMYEAVKQRSV